jgi:hypothetical protein
LHYHRSVMDGVAQRIATHFDAYFGPAAFNSRFCVVGCGFGWTIDHLIDRGFTNVVGTETSVYVLAEMDNSDEAELRTAITAVGLDPDTGRGAELLARHLTTGARRGRKLGAGVVTILGADISTDAGRTAVRTELGGWPQIVVSEDVMTNLTDAECLQFHADCGAFGGPQTVVHLVTPLMPNQDAGYNWKTLDDWVALIPSAIWISAVTGEVREP